MLAAAGIAVITSGRPRCRGATRSRCIRAVSDSTWTGLSRCRRRRARDRRAAARRRGFLPVDTHGRVAGVPGVYAAGDATDFDIKQGGIACQQADAAAEAIAADAGVAIDPAPFARCCAGFC